MPNPTKAELLAENRRLAKRLATLERAKAAKGDALALRTALQESKRREAALAGILQVMSRSPGDVQPVFEAIARTAKRLTSASSVSVTRIEGDHIHLAAVKTSSKASDTAIRRFYPVPARRGYVGEALRTGKQVYITDIHTDKRVHETTRKAFLERGDRCSLVTPMVRDGVVLGMLNLSHPRKSGFDDHQAALVRAFAEQAVIAIENARLFNETEESLEQQTAISEILRVISNSPSDVQPVLDAVAERAGRICSAEYVDIVLREGDTMRTRASVGDSIGRPTEVMKCDRSTVMGRSIVDAATLHIPDLQHEANKVDFPNGRLMAIKYGHRTILTVPLVREGVALGTFVLRRKESRPFDDKHVTLLKTFADQAAIAIENVRLFNETKEGLERQTATAEILKVISSSPSDVQPVFEAIVRNAGRVCDTADVVLALRDDSEGYVAAHWGPMGSGVGRRFTLAGGTIMGRSILESVTIPVDDALTSPDFPEGRKLAAQYGFHSGVSVPLLAGGRAIGAIILRRSEVRPFSAKQIEMAETFADQAVIAIENVRLFNETKESLERQTATAEILRVIASSPSDVQPVFEAIAASATRLLGGLSAVVTRVAGHELHLAAFTSTGAQGDDRLVSNFPVSLGAEHTLCWIARTGKTLNLADSETDPGVFEATRIMARARGYRSMVAVPMLRNGVPVGTLSVTRKEVGAFTAHEVGLLQTFADQAVIAIENVRLFNETKEALERQTATADILKVIAGSPSDVQPVLVAIGRSALRLFGAHSTSVWRAAGDLLHLAAFTSTGETGNEALSRRGPFSIQAAETLNTRAAKAGAPIFVADTETDPEFPQASRELARARGFRSLISVPMLRDREVLGAITVTRAEPGIFAQHQIDLLQTFADQAVIAIENVRLFNETKEALERQTATAEILKVIAESPTDTQPVFDAIAKSGARLVNGMNVALLLRQGEQVVVVGYSAPGREDLPEEVRKLPFDREKNFPSRVIQDGKVLHIPDWEGADIPEFERSVAKAYGVKAGLQVPMLRKGEGIGVIVVSRATTGDFDAKDVALLHSFADQAVIAIENVRLFNETKESLERQTATAEVLRVLGTSMTDTQPVFDVIVERAVRLCGASFGRVYRYDGSEISLVASHGLSAEGLGEVQRTFPRPASGDTLVGMVIQSKAPYFCRDAATDPAVPELSRRMIEALNTRSQVTLPMLRNGEPIGAFAIGWERVNAFDEQQVNLLRTFADQAVIAIENVRLFNETKEALEHQRASADILAVISSSVADTKPVFDKIADSAERLFSGRHVGIVLLHEDGLLHLAAHRGPAAETFAKRFPYAPGPQSMVFTGRAVQYADVFNDPNVPARTRASCEVTGAKAVMQCPLVSKGQGIGMIYVARERVGAFSDKETALLKTFADQAVIALENVRLFNETKEALERQTATADILKVISSSPTDDQPVFDAIVAACAKLFSGHQMGINLVDETGGVRLKACEGANREALYNYFREHIENESSPVMRLKGGVAHYPDIEQPEVPDKVRDACRVWGSRAIIYAPMVSRGRGIGAFWVARDRTGPFSEREISLLQTFADQAVIAIENVRLFKELESQTAALSRSVQKLTALGEVGQALSSTLDLETVLKTIVSRATQLTGLDGGAIYEFDEARQEFRLQTYENFAEELLQAARDEPIRLGNGAIGTAGLTREPVQVSDTLDASYQSDRKEVLNRVGYRALLAVPLLREDNLLGALLVTRRTPGAFPEEVVALLQTFATQSAMAIQNARLFREIAEKGKQLEIASHHKSDFLASMSHELRTPLNAILGFNELILAGIYGDPPEEMKEPLSDIQTSGKHLLRLINNVLDLAKIEAGRMELALADYSVHDTVESVRTTLRPLATEKGLDFIATLPEDLPLAHGDSGRITQCLMNLAGNSLKFTKQGKVEIAVQLKEGVLVYQVNDTGIGIPPEKIGSLFTEFKQTDATIASEYGGTGLGLSISKKFIEMHGGRVWVESEVGKGSSFIFEVPLRANAVKGAES